MFPYRFHQICVCFSFWAWSNCDWESAWFWFDLLLIIHLIERKLGKSERRNNRSKATSSSWLIYAYASIIWFDVISHYSLAVCVIWFVVSFFFFSFSLLLSFLWWYMTCLIQLRAKRVKFLQFVEGACLFKSYLFLLEHIPRWRKSLVKLSETCKSYNALELELNEYLQG